MEVTRPGKGFKAEQTTGNSSRGACSAKGSGVAFGESDTWMVHMIKEMNLRGLFLPADQQGVVLRHKHQNHQKKGLKSRPTPRAPELVSGSLVRGLDDDSCF